MSDVCGCSEGHDRSTQLFLRPAFVTRPEANWSKIQFLLGHVLIQKTKGYLGCKQRIQGAVIGIEPPD